MGDSDAWIRCDEGEVLVSVGQKVGGPQAAVEIKDRNRIKMGMGWLDNKQRRLR